MEIAKEIKTMEYDSNGNVIYIKYSDGHEEWYEHDAHRNTIHEKHSDGFEYWQEYDSNGKVIHMKYSDGPEYWNEYDSNGKLIHRKYAGGIEYWYDNRGNIIHSSILKDMNTGMSMIPTAILSMLQTPMEMKSGTDYPM